jgi:6-phosphogluconate dehydrogenase
MLPAAGQADIGVYGMGVMGRSLALNIASKGFRIAICNRSEMRLSVATEEMRQVRFLSVGHLKSMCVRQKT